MDKIKFSGIKLYMVATLTLIFCLFSIKTNAQKSFEGSIVYNISLTGKDSKALMANEPAKKMDLHIKDDNIIINLYEARIPRTFLYIGDSNHTYIVNMGANTYYLRDYYQADTGKAVPKAKLMKDSVLVKKEWCSVYRVIKPGEATIIYYVSDKYRVDIAKFKGKQEAKADFLIAGLDGRIPLRKVIKTKNLTITTEFSKITERELRIANFLIPRGFKRKKRDPRK